jgi:hypothetical protein
MYNKTKLWTAILAMTVAAGANYAQPAAAPVTESHRYYRLDLVLKEVEEGKVVNNRAYYTTLAGDKSAHASIRTRSRVWMPPAGATSPGVDTQGQYLDVGVNFDVWFREEIGDCLAVNVATELSGIAEGQGGGSGSERPIIRQSKWSSNAFVPFAKPTLVFSSDEPTGKRKMQLELTAAPIK